jgi:spore coat polysaccharide biosynthesis protein SpsF
MSSADVLIVLQARMGSKRLPGKSLMTIGGRSLLAQCVTRLESSNAGPVVVATSTLVEDDAIAVEAAGLGAIVFRGDADDVLERVCRAAALRDANFVVRATGDNPAVDPESIERLMNVMRLQPLDHAVEKGLPTGVTVEVMTAEALRVAARRATAPEDREHVTPYIRSAGNGFQCAVVPAPRELCRPDLRFTIDTWDDLEFMRRVFRGAGVSDRRHACVKHLIAAADATARADGEVA